MSQRCIRMLFVFVAAAALGGCVATPVSQDFHYDPQLLDGTALFGEPVAPADPIDLLGMSPAMQAFISPRITNPAASYTRFTRLMQALLEGRYFHQQYLRDGTFSAAQTFADRQGNCLGYTNMFIALARAAGLNARYQLIESQPVWNVQSGYLIRNNHINVLVDNIARPGKAQAQVTVDFNRVMPDPTQGSAQQVSDEFAAALFHANLAVDYLYDRQYRQAFAYLKRAVMLEPRNKVVWNNIAVLYSKLDHPRQAQQAHELALALDPGDKTAWTGLAVALTAQGLDAEAAVFTRKVERYQRKNPYYHFAVAQNAYSQDDYAAALAALEQAIDLRGNEARFFRLRAELAQELGDQQLLAHSERLAAKYAEKSQRSRRYSNDRRVGNLRNSILY